MNRFYKIVITLILSFSIFNYVSSINTIDPASIETTDVLAYNSQNKLIHSIGINDNNVSKLLESINSKKDLVFHFGNSQTQSINQYEDGQKNFIGLAAIKDQSIDLLANTLPNINLQEIWLLFNFWINNNVDINKILIPVFFDDMRETGIRDELIDFFEIKSFLLKSDDKVSKKINRAISLKKDENNNISFGKKIENRIENFLNNNFIFWEKRQKVKTSIYVNLYNLRNTIFNISPTSKRNLIKSSYDDNLFSLRKIIELSKERNIEVLLYIPPIRQDYNLPYDLIEYSKFKDEVKSLDMDFENVKYKNFEKIIPNEFWGTKQGTNLSSQSEIDFMHFQFNGHDLFSEIILNFIKN